MERKPVFDYGNITQEHKDAAEEIITMLEATGQSGLASDLRYKFQLAEIKKYDWSASEFVRYCKLADIYVAGQGHLMEGEGEDAMQYPLFAICEDVRKLEKLIHVIKNND